MTGSLTVVATGQSYSINMHQQCTNTQNREQQGSCDGSGMQFSGASGTGLCLLTVNVGLAWGSVLPDVYRHTWCTCRGHPQSTHVQSGGTVDHVQSLSRGAEQAAILCRRRPQLGQQPPVLSVPKAARSERVASKGQCGSPSMLARC